MIEIL